MRMMTEPESGDTDHISDTAPGPHHQVRESIFCNEWKISILKLAQKSKIGHLSS